MTTQLYRWVREPRVINAVQIIAFSLAAGTGLLAALGGIPNLLTGTIGAVLSVAIGTILVIGGSIGAFAVIVGFWWMERIALLITGLSYALLLFVTLWFAFTRSSSSTIWLIVQLEILAICDNIKRYRRIDWAYLDPTR
jgi:hypothetical protein